MNDRPENSATITPLCHDKKTNDNEFMDIEPLFHDIKIDTEWMQPTPAQIIDWIKQTNGIVTNEMLNYLGYPMKTNRSDIHYAGDLTIQQQIYILHELTDNHIYWNEHQTNER